MEKKLDEEKKQQMRKEKPKKTSKAAQEKELQVEAKRRLDIEIQHQKEEAETRALGRAMLSDASKNKPSFNNSCLKLLNNFQGTFFDIFKLSILITI